MRKLNIKKTLIKCQQLNYTICLSHAFLINLNFNFTVFLEINKTYENVKKIASALQLSKDPIMNMKS